VGKYISGTEISFTGTPMYEISLAHPDAGNATVKSGDTFLLPCDYTLTSFTDATGAPGIMKCLEPVTFTLTASAAGFCTGDAGITFALSGTENGRDYQLLRGATPVRTLQGTGSAATFSGVFNVAGAYAAVSVADADGVYCSVSMAGSHTVSEYPLPAIMHSGGDASQTVYQNSAITTITYTASNATGIALSSGSFPTGVTGTANGLVFTISGTPSVVGTFGYAVTASHTNGCTTNSSGTLTVTAVPTPPGAASTQTWTIGTQTWSAPLQKAQSGCTNATDLGTANPPTVAYYRSTGLYSGSGYLYNWKCVSEQAANLCPSPWRVPTKEDFITLDKAFGGNGLSEAPGSSYVSTHILQSWGGIPGGHADGNGISWIGNGGGWWSTNEENTTHGNLYHFNVSGTKYPDGYLVKRYGSQVRCVK
jgi:uncharacterized protein (TIGR02145 family)